MSKKKNYLKTNYYLLYRVFYEKSYSDKKNKFNFSVVFKRIINYVGLFAVCLFAFCYPIWVWKMGVNNLFELLLFILATLLGYSLFIVFFYLMSYYKFNRHIYMGNVIPSKNFLDRRRIIGWKHHSPLSYFILNVIIVFLCFYWLIINWLAWNSYATHMNFSQIASDLINIFFFSILFFENINLIKKMTKMFFEKEHTWSMFLKKNNLLCEGLFDNMKIVNNRYAVNDLLEIKSKTEIFSHYCSDNEKVYEVSNEEILMFYQNFWREYIKFKKDSDNHKIILNDTDVRRLLNCYVSVFVNFFDK